MSEIEMPEEFADALSQVASAYVRLREPLTDERVTDLWIDGLQAATRQAFERAKAWNGKYPRPLPFVIEGRCPFGHRTANHYDYATVRFVTREGGWWSYDPESKCPECTPDALATWMATCPKCEAGEDSETHFPFHARLDVVLLYDFANPEYQGLDYTELAGGGFDASPLAWVMREFMAAGQVAMARWWIEHTEEAARSIPRGVDRQRFLSDRLLWARSVQNTVPKAKTTRKAVKPMMTAEAGADWLDARGIPEGGEKTTWARVRDLPGCPAQSVIYAAVKVRKGRATAS